MNLTQKHNIEKGFRISIEESLYFDLFNKQIHSLPKEYQAYLYPIENFKHKQSNDKRPCLVYGRIGDFLILIPFTTSERFKDSNKTIYYNDKESLLKAPFFLLDVDKYNLVKNNQTNNISIFHWGTKKDIDNNLLLIEKYNEYLKNQHNDLFNKLVNLTKNENILNKSHSLNHLLYQVIDKNCQGGKNE